jgi:protein TonB
MAIQTSPGGTPGARQHVVVVDHDLDALRKVVAPLRGEFEFHLTVSASDALALLGRRPVAALIAGHKLFSSSGVELLNEARKRSPRTVRVLLTDPGERKAIEHSGIDSTAFQIVERPCTTQHLKDVLQVAAWSASVPVDETGEVEHVVMETAREQPAPESTGTPVTVLTNDADLYDAIRTAVQGRHETYLATRLEDAAELAATGRCPVLVTDFALAQPALQRIARHLGTHEPALVTVVVGSREQGNALMGLLGTGVIHRFLLKPVTPGLARLAIDSAARHHQGLLSQRTGPTGARAAHPAPKPAPRPPPRVESLAPVPAPKVEAPPPAPRKAEPPPPAPKKVEAPPPKVEAPPPKDDIPTLIPEGAPPSKPRFAPSPVLAGARDETTFELTSPIAVEAAATLEEEQPLRVKREIPRSTLIGGAIAAAVLLVAGLGWRLYESTRPAPADPRVQAIESNLASAQAAVEAGRLVEPAGDNAFHFYSEVLKNDAANETALQGIERIADTFIERAENHMVEGKLDDAALALAAVRQVSPDHRRLRFLDTQLRKEQQDLLLMQARQAATAGNTRRAQELLAEAARVVPDQTGQLDAAQEAISARERTQSVGRSLETARQRLAQNRLVAPPNDSAKYHLQTAQRAEPNNLAVQQGLRNLTARVVDEANQAVTRRQYDSARTWLREAESLGAPAEQLASIRAALQGAQQDREKNDLLQLVIRRTNENRLLEPAQDNARYYLGQLMAADAQYSGIPQGVSALGTRLVANAQLAISQREYDAAARLLTEARAIGFTGAELAVADAALRAARAPAAANLPPPVAPRRTKAVPPEYPRRALVDSTEGWVDVSFTVTPAGDVADARVEASTPRNLFDRAALNAVRQWKFEARTPETAYTQRMRTRLEFKLSEE